MTAKKSILQGRERTTHNVHDNGNRPRRHFVDLSVAGFEHIELSKWRISFDGITFELAPRPWVGGFRVKDTPIEFPIGTKPETMAKVLEFEAECRRRSEPTPDEDDEDDDEDWLTENLPKTEVKWQPIWAEYGLSGSEV